MNDIVIALLGNLSHWFGGNLGWGIVALSLGIRVALLPLTIKLARRARRNQELMQRLEPEIQSLKKRYEKKPERLWSEMRELYRKHDCNPFDVRVLAGSVVQLPIFAMLYSSISRSLSSGGALLWIKNLAAPDFLLTLVILLLTGASVYLTPSSSAPMRSTMVALQIVVTFFIVWKLAAGLGLYWASSGLVGVFQTLWLRYRNDGARAA